MDSDSQFIVKSQDQFGGRPHIAGTRITVGDIVGYYQVLLDDMIV